MKKNIKNYILENDAYWQRGYLGKAKNVESIIFRLQGTILKPKYNLPRKNHKVCLDFGCGQGATVNYMNSIGYDCYGIDISKKDISIARKMFPHIKHKFIICKPEIWKFDLNKFTKNKKIDLIICQQSLYYFDKEEFNLLLRKFKEALSSKGIIYASMISKHHSYYKKSKKIKGSTWIKEVNWKNARIKVLNYHIHFIDSVSKLKKNFDIFKILHTGNYTYQLDKTETNSHHYTIICQKKI